VTDQAGTTLTTNRMAGSLGGMTKRDLFSAPGLGGGHGHRPA